MLMQGIMEPEFLTILLVNQLIKSNFTFSITGTPLSKLHQEVLWSSDAHLSPTKRKVHVLAALQLLVLCSSGKKVIELHSLVLVKVCIKFQFFALKSSALVSKQANAQLCQYYSEKKSSSGHKSSESWNYSSVNPLGFSSTLLQKSHENVRISFCLSNFSVSVSPDYYVSLNLTKKKNLFTALWLHFQAHGVKVHILSVSDNLLTRVLDPKCHCHQSCPCWNKKEKRKAFIFYRAF